MASPPSALAPILIDVYLITCVVQRGRADPVVKAAIACGAEGATIHYAHGTGARQRMGVLSMAINAEKEVITIAVSGEQRQRVFEAMSVAAELDTPGMGFMYMTAVDQAATYIPPDILAALASEAATARSASSASSPETPPPSSPPQTPASVTVAVTSTSATVETPAPHSVPEDSVEGPGDDLSETEEPASGEAPR